MLKWVWGLVTVALASLTPAVEVRGSIPLTYYYFGREPSLKALSLLIAVTANLAVAPVLLAVLNRLDSFLLGLRGRYSVIRNAYIKLTASARRKGESYIGKWGYVGLAVFVSIPIPGSGAWTGSLIAYVLGLKYRESVLSIEAGVIMASAIITALIEAGVKAYELLP